jgi:hypothetical protein
VPFSDNAKRIWIDGERQVRCEDGDYRPSYRQGSDLPVNITVLELLPDRSRALGDPLIALQSDAFHQLGDTIERVLYSQRFREAKAIIATLEGEKAHSSITDWVEILTSERYTEDSLDGVTELMESIRLQGYEGMCLLSLESRDNGLRFTKPLTVL